MSLILMQYIAERSRRSKTLITQEFHGSAKIAIAFVKGFPAIRWVETIPENWQYLLWFYFISVHINII